MRIDRSRAQSAFAEYTAHYNAEDEKVKLKIDHTYRVADLCEQLARSIALSDEDTDMAWFSGLLHDVGRFEQLRRFGIFNDAESIDHALYGAQILFDEEKLWDYIGRDDISEEEMHFLRRVISCHSMYRVPEDYSAREKQFADILRDADKIDILKVNVEVPLEKIYNVTTEELEQAEVTQAVMDSFAEKHATLRAIKRTCIDHVVGHISLVYELVYPYSVEVVVKQGYLDRLMHFQSKNPKTQQQLGELRAMMNTYVAERLAQKTAQLTVKTGQVTGSLGDLYGIFFEDLNHAADGGLYAEMVQNRSFEFSPVDNPAYHPLMAWEKIEKKYSRLQWWIQDAHPYSRRNPHYLVCEIFDKGEGAGVRNQGFNPGMYFEEGAKYFFSCLAANDDRGELPLRIVLEDEHGEALGEAHITVVRGTKWNRYQATLCAARTVTKGSLAIYIEAAGRLYLDMVSLFPENTYLGRRNGLRADIAELLAQLKPKFMRFPGGCLVHDGSINAEDRDSLYRWKNTIGALEERPARRNNWGYNQTLGLGYYEYFCFCEEIGAKPLPVLPAGYDPHHQRKVPFDRLDEWIQDALDLIEFANGDAQTKWGAVRCELGHEKPFHLEYIGIGNEEVGEGFFERYPYFHKAIKEKYPDMKIIASSGPFATGGEYEKGWRCAKDNYADLVDEHYYQAPEWFLANHYRYDAFDAKGPKVFLGEYASWGNTWYNALTEASYMTAMERNSDKVALACYAPLLCNVNYVNWKPDMIWFDNHQAYGSANYYVQKLFMNHQGTDKLAFEMTGLPVAVTMQDNPVGDFGFRTEPDTVVRYEKVKIRDLETQALWEDDAVYYVGEAADQYAAGIPAITKDTVLHTVTSPHYEITMTARMLQGRRGFFVQFGAQDAANRYQWEIGGWQNMDSAITQDISGRNSCLTQSSYTVEADRDYALRLVVDGRHMSAYIDGELIHDTDHAPVVIEPLYAAASKDSATGEIIVKLVNVQDRAMDVLIRLDGIERADGMADIMSGYAPEAANSFAEPMLVAPREESIALQEGCCRYHVDACSVQVLRFRECPCGTR